MFFDRDALVNGDFNLIKIGTEVRYDEGHGDKGAQATRVHIVSPGGTKF